MDFEKKDLLAVMEQDLRGRLEWDLPPEVGVIASDESGVRLVSLDVPEFIWEAAGTPVVALKAMAASGARLLGPVFSRVDPEQMEGFWISVEAWSASQELAKAIVLGEVDQEKLPPLADIVGTVESRYCMAVDLHGILHVIYHERGSGLYEALDTMTDGALAGALRSLLGNFVMGGLALMTKDSPDRRVN